MDTFARGLAVDVETTGLSNRDEVIELTAVTFIYNTETGIISHIEERYSGLRQPSVPINPHAAKVNGITRADLAGKTLDEDTIARMISAANIIVAHNAAFDRRFIIKLFPSAKRRPWRCSMNGLPWKRMGFRNAKLQDIAQALDIKPNQAHRALNDVLTMLEILQHKPLNSRLPLSSRLFRKPSIHIAYS